MSVRVSVLTMTYRPGYIASLVDALKGQTFNGRFELVLVDELVEKRRDLVRDCVGGAFPVTHVPPSEITDISATALALNTGLVHCRGELVHFMADYMYPHPGVLERHWELYQRYGPKVVITGPLIDRITSEGRAVSLGAPPILYTVTVGDQVVQYPELSPPIEWPLTPNFREPTKANLLSIFQRPFTPIWPARLPPDWRTGLISNVSLERDLYENRQPEPWKWWWAGRSDSAPLEALLVANGMDERSQGRRGGLETDLCRRMMEWGCRFLVDRQAPAYMLPHPARKREVSDWKDDKGQWVSQGAHYSLRERRAQVLAEKGVRA